jgi:cell shape-determining protein MreC
VLNICHKLTYILKIILINLKLIVIVIIHYNDSSEHENLRNILLKNSNEKYKNKIKQLQDENKKLKEEIYYSPYGDGMKIAQEDFNMLKENKN